MSETQFEVEGQAEEDASVYMEEILEKLKLLNYERDFVSQSGMKQLNRAYFAVPLNQNEQFNYFTRITQWLFKLNGSNVEFN